MMLLKMKGFHFFMMGLVWICFFMLQSRTILAQEFQGGVFAGINTSQITGDDLGGYDKLGLSIGFAGRRAFNKKWAFHMEIGYLGKGSRTNLSQRDTFINFYRLKLHYIEVPMLFQYRISPAFEIEAGPSLGVLFKWYEEDIQGELGGPNSSSQQFKLYDLSGAYGATWWVKEKWGINIRSLSSIFPVRNHDQNAHYRLNRGQYTSCIMGRIIHIF